MRQRIFAISDLHLSINNPKPMDIFGGNWEGYVDRIVEDWNKKVRPQDIVIIAGDISWAMKLDDARPDLDFIGRLKGIKIIIRGNHDYWWGTISNVRKILPPNMYAIQNDSLRIGKYIFCGSRGWGLPEKRDFTDDDKKILDRELQRFKLSLESANKERKGREKIYCLIHYPPFNSEADDSPYTELFEKYNVHSVIYGHLHSRSKSILYTKKNKIRYYLTSCDKVNNKLVRIK